MYMLCIDFHYYAFTVGKCPFYALTLGTLKKSVELICQINLDIIAIFFLIIRGFMKYVMLK